MTTVHTFENMLRLLPPERARAFRELRRCRCEAQTLVATSAPDPRRLRILRARGRTWASIAGVEYKEIQS